jgi:hypothetical protein
MDVTRSIYRKDEGLGSTFRTFVTKHALHTSETCERSHLVSIAVPFTPFTEAHATFLDYKFSHQQSLDVMACQRATLRSNSLRNSPPLLLHSTNL